MDLEDLAKRTREKCIEAVLQAYVDAGIQGLCAEGRWEVAVGALRTLDLTPVLRQDGKPCTSTNILRLTHHGCLPRIFALSSAC